MTRVNIAGREFGSTGAKTDPGDAKTRLGHVAEIVPFQNENFWKNQFAGMLAHLEVYGIAVWDAATTYVLNSYAVGSNGFIYRAIASPYINQDPVSSPTQWIKAFVDYDTVETITAIKTFNALKLGGNQDANNKKITLLATPTSNQDATNKAYVDAKTDGDDHTFLDSESNAMVKGHVYETQTSGFVTAYSSGITGNTIYCYVNSSDAGPASGPTITQPKSNTNGVTAVSFFVGKGKFFDMAHAADDLIISWTPLMAGGGNPIDRD